MPWFTFSQFQIIQYHCSSCLHEQHIDAFAAINRVYFTMQRYLCAHFNSHTIKNFCDAVENKENCNATSHLTKLRSTGNDINHFSLFFGILRIFEYFIRRKKRDSLNLWYHVSMVYRWSSGEKIYMENLLKMIECANKYGTKWNGKTISDRKSTDIFDLFSFLSIVTLTICTHSQQKWASKRKWSEAATSSAIKQKCIGLQLKRSDVLFVFPSTPRMNVFHRTHSDLLILNPKWKMWQIEKLTNM